MNRNYESINSKYYKTKIVSIILEVLRKSIANEYSNYEKIIKMLDIKENPLG